MGNFERFQYFNFEANFLEKRNFFQKIWSSVFYWKAVRLKTQHFHTKQPRQKVMLRQIELGVQNGPQRMEFCQ